VPQQSGGESAKDEELFSLVKVFWYWLTRVVPDKGSQNDWCCLLLVEVSAVSFLQCSDFSNYWLSAIKGIQPAKTTVDAVSSGGTEPMW